MAIWSISEKAVLRQPSALADSSGIASDIELMQGAITQALPIAKEQARSPQLL